KFVDLGGPGAMGPGHVGKDGAEGFGSTVEIGADLIELGMRLSILAVPSNRHQSTVGASHLLGHVQSPFEASVVHRMVPVREGKKLLDLSPGSCQGAGPLDGEAPAHLAENPSMIVQEVSESDDAAREIPGLALGVEHMAKPDEQAPRRRERVSTRERGGNLERVSHGDHDPHGSAELL